MSKKFGVLTFGFVLLAWVQVSVAATDQLGHHFFQNSTMSLRSIVNAILKDHKVKISEKKQESQQSSMMEKSKSGKQEISQRLYQAFSQLGFMNDLSTTHKNLPGVISGGDYDAKLYIRGGQSSETKTLLNGQVISSPYVWNGRGSMINPLLIKKTTFYRGSFPASYPGVLSGIIDIEEKIGDLYVYRFLLDQNLSELQLLLEGPFIRGQNSLVVSVRRSYYDFFVRSKNTIFPHIESYSQKFYTKLNEDHELEVNMKNYFDSLRINNRDVNLGETGDHLSVSQRNMIGGTVTSRWNDHLQSKLTIGYENSLITWKKEISQTVTAGVNYADEPMVLRLDTTWKASDQHLIKSGVYANHLRRDYEAENMNQLKNLRYANLISDTNSENYVIDYTTYALYLQDEWTLLDKAILLNSGLRFSWLGKDTLSQAKAIQPRVTVQFDNPDQTRQLSLSWGRYAVFNNPVMNDQLVDVAPEWATHWNLGMKSVLTTNIGLEVNVFKKDYSSLVYAIADPTSNIISGYNNQKTGIAKGFEVLLEKKSEGRDWYGWISYTNSHVFYSDPGLGTYDADHDQRHTLSMVGMFPLGKDLKLMMNWRFNTGKPYTDVTGTNSANVQSVLTSQYNAARLPDYSNLTVTLEYAKPIWPLSQFQGSTYLGVTNLLDNNNVYSYLWDAAFAQKSAINMLPIFPIFGIKVVF